MWEEQRVDPRLTICSDRQDLNLTMFGENYHLGVVLPLNEVKFKITHVIILPNSVLTSVN